MNIIESDKSAVIGTYARQAVVLVKGKGATATDENGREYIDFGSGIGVNSLGYCDDEWVKAVSEQSATIQHASNLYYTAPATRLALLLKEKAGYEKTLFCNSGAEANECAIKLARKYSFDKYKTKERSKILTLVNSFHGRTVTTLSATGQEVFHNYFFPFTDGFCHAVANDASAAVSELEKGGYCAVMLELIQGEGGVVPLEKEYVRELFSYCEGHDILIIADEVQTGIGRTGKLLAAEHYGVTPNITTLAKGLGGGLPIGACMADEKTAEVFHFGDHGTTFGGNPVACAGAVSVLSRIAQKDFLAAVCQKADFIKKELEGLCEVEEISGLGLMIGIKLKTKQAKDVLAGCLENGLIILTAKDKLRLLPPLNITQAELVKGLAVLKEQLLK